SDHESDRGTVAELADLEADRVGSCCGSHRLGLVQGHQGALGIGGTGIVSLREPAGSRHKNPSKSPDRGPRRARRRLGAQQFRSLIHTAPLCPAVEQGLTRQARPAGTAAWLCPRKQFFVRGTRGERIGAVVFSNRRASFFKSRRTEAIIKIARVIAAAV